MASVSTHVISAIHHVQDFESWWEQVRGGHVQLTALGTRRLGIYRSLSDPNQVFFAMGIPAREPLDRLLRSGLVLKWFDAAGVEEVPPIFVGRAGARLDVVPEGDRDTPPGVVVAALALVPEPDAVMSLLGDDENELRELGVRSVWVYQAVDDANEVLIVLAVETERQAARWMRDPQLLGGKLMGNGLGVYPPLFAGKLAGNIELQRRG